MPFTHSWPQGAVHRSKGRYRKMPASPDPVCEKGMNESGRTSDIVARQVKEALTGEQTAPSPVTGPSVRLAAQRAAAGARSLGRGAEYLAREVVEGTVRAAGEITGETTTIIRDAVIGANATYLVTISN